MVLDAAAREQRKLNVETAGVGKFVAILDKLVATDLAGHRRYLLAPLSVLGSAIRRRQCSTAHNLGANGAVLVV